MPTTFDLTSSIHRFPAEDGAFWLCAGGGFFGGTNSPASEIDLWATNLTMNLA
jgi:hypothetical protein